MSSLLSTIINSAKAFTDLARWPSRLPAVVHAFLEVLHEQARHASPLLYLLYYEGRLC